MDEKMEDTFENGCDFESLSEIDLDYEFDVPKFFDFTTPETDEDIAQADLWLQSALGYPSLYEFVSKPKSKCPSQSTLPQSSRLLKPTASYLAKQNLPFTVRSTRSSHGRHQNLGSLSSAEIIATKRQKFEVGFLNKYDLLKHQSCFLHKSAKKVVDTDCNSSSRPKVTVPKEPDLETAHRAQRHRLKKATHQGFDSISDSCSTRSSLQETESRRMRSFSFNYKKDFKLPRIKKLSKDPPMEMLEKLSINSEKQAMSERKKPLPKIPGASTGKSRSCMSRSSGGSATTGAENHSTSFRSPLDLECGCNTNLMVPNNST